MSLTEQVYAQALLLAGDLEERQCQLLQVLSTAATATLTAQLREGITPEDCKADFIAAASLIALAQLNTVTEDAQIEHFQAGELTLKRSAAARDAASRCLQRQAELMISPYLKDPFVFLGV